MCIAPRRKRVRLFYQVYDKNIQQEEVCAFLRDLLGSLRGPLFVIWDNASIHKGEQIRKLCAHFPRLHLEYLPPYAPELNPDEGVWGYVKGRLANGRPMDLRGLRRQLEAALRELKRAPRRLRHCIHQSALPPFLP